MINLEETVSDLNETVVNLSETVEEHKSQTSSELADLQSSIDNPPTDEIANAVLLKLLPYLNNMEEDLCEKIYKTVEKQTETLASLHKSTNASVNDLTGDLQDGLSMINGSITDLRDKVCDISDTVRNVNETISSLEETVEEHERQTKSVLVDLQEKVDESAAGLAKDIHDWMSSINGTVTDVRVKVCDPNETIRIQTTSQLAAVHSWDLSNMTGDIQCIKNELKQISGHLDKPSNCCSPSSVEPSPVRSIPCPPPPFPTYACGGEEGWRRVVYLDMTDNNTDCPSGWKPIDQPKKTCGRVSAGRLTCDSVFFPVTGGEYTKVCGTIVGYQYDDTDAFEAYDDGEVTTIDGAYAAGVSLTHGRPGSRQHIWTFVAGISEYFISRNDACPCDATIFIRTPPFVGGDYFCESGATESVQGFHEHDSLWDGKNCTGSSTCCSFNNPPYFTKQLSSPTTDDIEARICQKGDGDDSPIELIELYVK